MEDFVLLFGMVATIIIDSYIRFKNIFKYMCADLGIIYWPLARGNNKGTIIEKYHLFINKTQAIADQYIVTHVSYDLSIIIIVLMTGLIIL